MKPKINIAIIVIITFVVIAFTISIYFIFGYGDTKIINDNLANYVGGIIGTVIAFFNLVVLIQLTKAANRIQDVENDKQRRFQKKLIITEMLKKDVDIISNCLYSLQEEILNNLNSGKTKRMENTKTTLMRVRVILDRYNATKKELFEGTNYIELIELIKKLYDEQNQLVVAELAAKDYRNESNKMINKLQENLIKQMDDKKVDE